MRTTTMTMNECTALYCPKVVEVEMQMDGPLPISPGTRTVITGLETMIPFVVCIRPRATPGPDNGRIMSKIEFEGNGGWPLR